MTTTKVVYNDSMGSFGLSPGALALWQQRSQRACLHTGLDIPRTDPDLVYVVETMGKAANGRNANLRIREVPKGVRYIIQDHHVGGDSVVTEDEFDWFTA